MDQTLLETTGILRNETVNEKNLLVELPYGHEQPKILTKLQEAGFRLKPQRYNWQCVFLRYCSHINE